MRSRSRVKILVWLALGFFALLAPLASNIYLSGSAYAGGSNDQGQNNNDQGQNNNDQGSSRVHTPEPATWLLVGFGVAGAALVWKKFRK